MINRLRSQKGLSIVEVMSSIVVFSLVTVGITPLIAMSLRGSGLSRSYTVGKNLAVQAMERVRGLPFFESVKGQSAPTRRDLLDLYFPDMGAGYASGTFTTTCTTTSQTPAASGPAACPPRLSDGSTALPQGYTVSFQAQFVQPGAISGGRQTFTVVTPPSNYSWSALSTETPPAQVLRLTVRASWSYGSGSKSYRLTSLFGERSLSPDKVAGVADIDFALQSVTSYLGDDGKVSTLTSTAGDMRSAIESRSVSGADHDVRAGRVTLVDEEFNGVPGTVRQDLFGAAMILHAPPDSFYAPNVTGVEKTATYQTSPSSPFTNVAYIGPTSASQTGVRVVDELPRAEGLFGFTGADPIYWMDNQASTGNRAELKLHGTRNVLQIRTATLGMDGSTKAETTPLTPTSARKVQTTVSADVGRFDLFPTTFIGLEQRAVIVVRDFELDLQCTSTANAASASATGTWTAKFKYWRDLSNDGSTNGGYSPEVVISGSTAGGTESLEAIQASNPLVYDDNNNANDVYLFKTDTLKGYLQDWSMTPTIVSGEDGAGRATSASIEGAIQFVTNATNPAIAASALNITLGKASCSAVDKR